jgi:hypothetical protein
MFQQRREQVGECWVFIFFAVKFEVEVDRQQVEVEVDRQQVKGRGSQPSKFEVEDMDDKRSKCGCEMID